jgi:hypothetical protein
VISDEAFNQNLYMTTSNFIANNMNQMMMNNMSQTNAVMFSWTGP